MELHTLLYDFVDVVGKTCCVERILVVPNESGVSFTAISHKDSPYSRFHIKGQTESKIDGVDYAFGIQGLSHLKKILYAPNFSRATTTAVIDEFNSDCWKNLSIENHAGDKVSFSLNVKERAARGMAIVRQKVEISYCIHFRITQAHYEVLKYWRDYQKTYLSGDLKFVPETMNGLFYLNIGQCEAIDVKVLFAEHIKTSLPRVQVYEGEMFFKLTSMYKEVKDLVVSFSDQGVCRIRIVTRSAVYEFYLCALN